MSYCGDAGDVCACCDERIGLDGDGCYSCACTSGSCDECDDYEEEVEET